MNSAKVPLFELSNRSGSGIQKESSQYISKLGRTVKNSDEHWYKDFKMASIDFSPTDVDFYNNMKDLDELSLISVFDITDAFTYTPVENKEETVEPDKQEYGCIKAVLGERGGFNNTTELRQMKHNKAMASKDKKK